MGCEAGGGGESLADVWTCLTVVGVGGGTGDRWVVEVEVLSDCESE